jgi:putative transposase
MSFPIETLKKFWKIKKITKPMMNFKAFHSAKATIDGIETAHMIRKRQLSDENIPAYKQFMALAG